MKPEFSILMANYNNDKYITTAIQSVIDQTQKSWELIIIDDCSTDNSIKIIKPFLWDKRIKLLRNKNNIGYIRTLKKLINKSTTEIVGILDSDDMLSRDAIETIITGYKKNPDFGFIYSQFIICDKNLKPLKTGYCKIIPKGKTNLYKSYASHFKTFKKSYYLKTKGYDENILYAEDKDIILKMEEISNFLFINKPLYFYRTLPHSQGHDSIKSKIGNINFKIAKYNAYKRRKKTKIPNISAKKMSYNLFIVSANSLKIKMYLTMVRFFFIAIKLSPFNFKGYRIFFLITSKHILLLLKKFLKK